MSDLYEIFEVLKDVGLCDTQAEFSELWLGRSAHYVSQIKGNPERASLTSLRLLASELELITLISKQSSDKATYRKIRSAWVRARTICDGVGELRYVRPHYRMTASLH